MIDVVEILQHWHAGRPKAVVASSLGVDAKTVRKYVRPAEDAGMTPGGPPLGRDAWAALVAEWFPQLTDAKARSLTFAAIDAHRDRIKVMLKTNRPSTVYQRLRDEHDLDVSVTSFRRYLWTEFPDASDTSRVTVPRPDVPAGDEAQVDYGFVGSWQDPITQRVRRVWAFIMVLACSRHLFVRPVLDMDQGAWVAAHVAAFSFFGGAPRRVVCDNLKTGVIKPDLYDPRLNRAYAELGHYYGVLIDPARASKPKDKPRVERQVPYVRDSMWRGRVWAGEAEMQHAALTWCVEVAGRRAHRGLDGATPLATFDAVEADTLIALPAEPFELATWSTPKVAPDCHVKVGAALYSVPWRHIGVRVDARLGERTVEIYLDGQLIKTHPRVTRGRRTDYADYPPEKVAFFMRTPTWCRHRAAELGHHVAAVIDELLAGGALHHLRAAQGVLGLAERHDHARVDAACHRALEVGDPSYRTVKGILAAGTDTPNDADETAAAAVAAHLHGPDSLFHGLAEEVGR